MSIKLQILTPLPMQFRKKNQFIRRIIVYFAYKFMVLRFPFGFYHM